MVQQTQPGFGLPPMGFVPTGAMDSIYPYLTYLPNLASTLAQAQFGEQGATQRAQIAAAAARAGDQARARATVQAAGLGANAQIQSQQIQTKGMLQATLAQIMGDLEKARNGDIAAGYRLNASMQQAAALANQDKALELAKMMGSGQLRDTIGARLALRGFGQMPGIGSALNGLENRIWTSAPTVQEAPMYTAPKINMNVGGGGGGASFNAGTSFGGGGGGGGGFIGTTTPDMNSIFNSIFSNVKGTVNFGDVFGTAPAAPALEPLASPNPTFNTIQGWMNNGQPKDFTSTKALIDSLNANSLSTGTAQGNAVFVPGNTTGLKPLAKGGSSSGEPVLVGEGENLEGLRAGTAEVAVPEGEMDVYPIKSPMKRAALGTNVEARYARYGKPAFSNFDFGKIRDRFKSSTPTPTAPSGPTGISSPAPNLMNTNTAGMSTFTPPSTTPNQGITSYFGQGALGGATGGSLADVNQSPFLAMLRTGKVMPAFGRMGALSEPGLGIGSTPAPFQAASTFSKMSPQDMEDALQMWEFLGVPRTVAAYQIASATPGYRFNPQRAFSF